MNNITNIFKGLIAIGIVVLLVFFGLTVFVFLLGLACVAGVLFWLKKQFSPHVPAYSPSHAAKDFSENMTRDDYTSATIIEGVAEEVTLDNTVNIPRK